VVVSHGCLRLRTPAVSGAAVLAFLSIGCGSSPIVPTSTATLTPVAISPNNNTTITQNNPASGCANTSVGFGYVIQFVWMPPTVSNGVVAYEVFAHKSDAPIPILDTTATGTSYTFTACEAYVVQRNLQGWQWRVRAQDAQGRFTDWSPWATFQFGPPPE
jgi:hypothetical protein